MTDPREEVWRIGRRTRDWLITRGAWYPFETIVNWLAPRIVLSNTPEKSFVTRDGFHLSLPPGLPAAQRYQEGCYEPGVVKAFQRTVRSGGTVVDAGANIGYFTLLASRLVGPEGHVLAFEPDPTNFSYLVRNVQSNGCTNVEPVQLALSDRNGSLPFRRDRFRTEGHLTDTRFDERKDILVDAIRLDDFVKTHPVSDVQLIKLDIEGNEPAALRGATATTARWKAAHLVVEYSRKALTRGGRADSELFEVLTALGFKFARALDEPGPEFPLNTPPPLAGHTESLEVWR